MSCKAGIQKREVERLRKNLEDSLRFQSVAQLTKGLSHNFNNILVGIVGYAGIIRTELSGIEHKEIPEILRYLNIVEDLASRASNLIRHLMTLSSKIEYEKSAVSINDSVMNALGILQLSLSENIVIKTQLQEDMPLIEADIMIN